MKNSRLAAVLACILGLFASTHAVAGNLVVGGKNFTEQLILSSMTAQYLSANGYSVDLKNGLGTTIMRQAQESGQLDIVWDYTGTALIVYNKVDEKLDREQSYQRVKELDAARNLVWLAPSALNNTYALAVPQKRADEEGLNSIEDLANKINLDHQQNRQDLIGVDFEFASRPDGLEPLQKLYGFAFERSEVKQMDPGLVYTALHNDQLNVGLTYASDGRVRGFNLKLLEDNKGFFPFYSATPVVRKEILDANPQLADQLNALSAKIDTARMAEMNKKVDIDQLPVEQVAADFLRNEGLLPDMK
ncbi:glycine betaine ABC transporter substrate-binding protein [Paraherbaspirillum soli]|uniref:Glycine betaine ABC transporter substrate-binding protein n=1 Tax=Paraherbaspirillum soli TaxID=631222 RepID=A0ABW0MB14_9BURK